MRPHRQLPEDVALSLAVARVWEAFELTGWERERSPLRPITIVLRAAGDEADVSALTEAVEDEIERQPWRSREYRAALKLLVAALTERDPDGNRFRRLDIAGEPVLVSAFLPSRQKRVPAVLTCVAELLRSGTLARGGLLGAYCEHP